MGVQLAASVKTARMATIMASSPKMFGRYAVVRLLGEGAMGKVFLADDPVLKRQVAIKVISVDRQLDDATRREYLSRFALEARLSAQLNHPSIVPVYDAGEEAGVPWIAFQYIDGVTLDKILKTKGALSVKWAAHIALDIAAALQHAHETRVVHRDIKPANIMVDRHGGTAKLTDFGVAKVPWASFTCEGNAMGSPGYMSPEQVQGFTLDERSDLFSLGVVLYEMVTGRHPFVRDTVAATAYAVIGGTYPAPSDIVKGVSPQLESIIARCLAPDPAKRVPSASQLCTLLREVLPVGTSGGRTSGSMLFRKKNGKPLWRSFVGRHRKRINLAVIALGVLAAVAMVSISLPLQQKAGLYLPTTGLDESGRRMAAHVGSWIDANTMDSVLSFADAIVAREAGDARGQFLRGVVAFSRGKYDDARTAFDKALQLTGGRKLVEHNRRYMAELYLHLFSARRAPDAAVALLAKKLSVADDPAMKTALYERPYWLRWNALRTLQVAGKKVDLVAVFILDIRFADDVRVRMQAARDLGDLNDRRAVPALKEAYARHSRDPLVSAAAGKVLKEIFKEKI
jgi:tRNA A-37 threonylcarbamoyl transferase component Bud32